VHAEEATFRRNEIQTSESEKKEKKKNNPPSLIGWPLAGNQSGAVSGSATNHRRVEGSRKSNRPETGGGGGKSSGFKGCIKLILPMAFSIGR